MSRRRVSIKRSIAAKLVEIVGVIVIFWLIATVGVPYLVASFSDSYRETFEPSTTAAP